MRTKLSILIMVLLVCVFSFTACDINGKTKAAKLKEQQKLEEEEKLKKIDILVNGKIGNMPANEDLKGKHFAYDASTVNLTFDKDSNDASTVNLTFDKDSNSCYIRLTHSVHVFGQTTGEYTVNGDKITIDFTRYTDLLAAITEEECLAWYKKLLYDSALKNGYDPEKNWDALWAEHEKKFKEMTDGITVMEMIRMQHENFNKAFTKYRTYPQVYEGTISADKKRIKISKIVFADLGNPDICTFENIELVEE